MHGRELQRGLTGVTCRLAHCRQQQWPARDGLHACYRVSGAAVPTPPVVDQRTRACRGLAAVDILRGEAAHLPLVLQLVKAVLAISPVAVELPYGLDGVGHVGDHHRVLP